MLHVKFNFTGQQSEVQNVKNENCGPPAGVNCTSKYVPVRTRVVYNSNVKKSQVLGLLARGNKVKTLINGISGQKLVSNRVTPPSSTIQASSDSVHAGYKVSDHMNVAVSVQNSTSGEVRQQEVANAEGAHNPVTPISLDIVNTDQCMNKQASGKVHNVSIHNNNTNDGSVDPKVSSESQYKLLFDINQQGTDDKFLMAVLNGKNERKIHTNVVSQYFSNWRAQTEFDFGFVPLGDFVMPDELTQVGDIIECPIEAHKYVKQSGKPNFLGCRVPVKSQLNVKAWKDMLRGYWDKQLLLLHLLEFGFPLDFNRGSKLNCDYKNHSSATDNPRDVEAYLMEELQHGAIMGPFDEIPIPNCHFSPFMTREKSGSQNRRVIVDLSWPKHASVNTGIDKASYLGTEFNLTFPTIDNITGELKKLGRGCHLYKVDVSRAFRHIKIDPHDYDLLGLKWRNEAFFNTCLPFGNSHGTQIFQRFSDAVRHVMYVKGFTVLNYVDDFIGLGTPDVARRSCDALCDVMNELGLDISQRKFVPPGTVVVCLGVEINTIEATVSIPREKLTQVVTLVKEWLPKISCSRRQLQSLLGNLLYIHKCVKPARIFVNRMLDLLRAHYDASTIHLTQDFRRDLRWFAKFLTKYNGVSYFDHRPVDYVVELDACLVGLGGRCQNLVYHLPLVRHYKNLTIVHLEMVNILVAIRVFGHLWHRKQILIKCDNQAVVQVLASGKTKDPFLAACARNVWYECALMDIMIKYEHVMGKNNRVADLLSRWQGHDCQFRELSSLVQGPIWANVTLAQLEIDSDI